MLNAIASIWRENMHVYLFLDIACSSNLAGLLELRSHLGTSLPADKYPYIFLRQMATVSLYRVVVVLESESTSLRETDL